MSRLTDDSSGSFRHVYVLLKDRHVRITTTSGELLRELELDPTRDYQPQPKT